MRVLVCFWEGIKLVGQSHARQFPDIGMHVGTRLWDVLIIPSEDPECNGGFVQSYGKAQTARRLVKES